MLAGKGDQNKKEDGAISLEWKVEAVFPSRPLVGGMPGERDFPERVDRGPFAPITFLDSLA